MKRVWWTATVVWSLLAVAYLIGVVSWPRVQHETRVVEFTIVFWTWVIGNIALLIIGLIVRRVGRRPKLSENS